MHRFIALFISQLLIIQLSGQSSFSFYPPLDIPMILSGNFGEIRADHFHSGIDIKTQGTIGHPVHAIEEGYVSRIKVQANGYGKSIYIDHPGGYTSVYGHLDRYREDIAEFVKGIQYKRHSHQVDLYLEPGQFTIEKGALIAFSGNTGGSSGPHLHFEIRTSGNQHPTNVLKYGFAIADQVPPRFHSISITPEGAESHVNGNAEQLSFSVVRDNGMYTVPYGTTIRAFGRLGIGAEVFDYLNGASNRCGVYRLEMFIDGEQVYSHVMDEFSFSETRYVNAHMEYGELIRSNKKMHRLYRLPNDRLRIYGEMKEDGWVRVDHHETKQVRVVAEDVAGNSSILEFQVIGDSTVQRKKTATSDNTQTMQWNRSNRYVEDELTVEVPANALYRDIQFSVSKSPGTGEMRSDLYHIHSPDEPVHLPYSLSIRYTLQNPELKDKLLLVTLDEDGKLEEAGGEYKEGAVISNPRNFGPFAVASDTVRPEIIPLGKFDQGKISGATQLRFTVRDNLSGIEDYDGYIDNHWVLFEYDPKNDLLTYTFDPERIQQDTLHELELYVTDAKGNINLYHTTFTW